jgi:hypothetical protein
LHLIDHSRAFRTSKDRPPDEEDAELIITPVMAERLRAIDIETLYETLDGILSKAQIRAVKKRMDRVLAEARVEEPASGPPGSPRRSRLADGVRRVAAAAIW